MGPRASDLSRPVRCKRTGQGKRSFVPGKQGSRTPHNVRQVSAVFRDVHQIAQVGCNPDALTVEKWGRGTPMPDPMIKRNDGKGVR